MPLRTLIGEEFLGSYGALGGEIDLYGDWVPGNDPETASEDILGLAGYLSNTEVPLLAARRIAIRETQKRFDTETDPAGIPWVPLDPDYEEQKSAAGYPDNILVREDVLRTAATSEEAWLVADNLLVFNPQVLPSYGEYHQRGTGDTESILAFRAKKQAWRDSKPGDKGGKHLGGMGRGNNLPQRQFIGLSEEGVEAIVAEFDAWFDTGVAEVFTHTKGPHRGRQQMRIGGKFGPFL